MKKFLIAGLAIFPSFVLASTFTTLHYECSGRYTSAQVSEDAEIEFLATVSDDDKYGANLPAIWNDRFAIVADISQLGSGSHPHLKV